MLLGFSTECLYKTYDNLSPKTFDIFRKLGANAIELSIRNFEDANYLLAITPDDLIYFEYISIHAPLFDPFDAIEIGKFKEVLQIFEKFSERNKINAIVLHPDSIRDWDMIEQFNLPFKIENMDWKKEVGKYVESMEDIFKKNNFAMVLNLNHCFTNDPTMHLAKEMSDVFGGRIEAVSISGFEKNHEPLFKTKQIEIIKAVPDKRLPIIIESKCEDIDELQKEFEYIKKYLKI